MLYQDTLTGMLHEVPDSQVYGWGLAEDPYGMGEGQVIYDGLGNPLGWGFLKKIGGLVKKALPAVAPMLGPYGMILSRALPAARRALAPVAASTAQALRQQALRQQQAMQQQALQQQALQQQALQEQAQPQLEGVAVGVPAPGALSPMPMRPPWPAGWRRPQLPYTGPQPRRLYLRCSAWPGPRGLVPAIAAQAAAATPPAAAAAAQTAAVRGAMRRRGRGRRR